jgi:hypothetical protein
MYKKCQLCAYNDQDKSKKLHFIINYHCQKQSMNMNFHISEKEFG